MQRRSFLLALVGAALPAAVQAQSNPQTGNSAGVVHGQTPAPRQDLNSNAAPGGVNPNRNEQVRRRAQNANRALTPEQERQRATNRQRQQATREARQRREAAAGQQQREARTAGGTPGGRTSDSVAAQEARMAEARRRQAEATRRATEQQDGVRFAPGPLGGGR